MSSALFFELVLDMNEKKSRNRDGKNGVMLSFKRICGCSDKLFNLLCVPLRAKFGKIFGAKIQRLCQSP